ncbi:hypothetical protein B0H21DRAFT_174895 [Amylocystis lapponica]|nr:hypothetical protein B0H21DRAFT_174895 [Amylocystis lapponica]
MTQDLYEALTIGRTVPCALSPTLPSTNYRNSFDGDWNYDISSNQDTEKPPVDSIDAILDELRIGVIWQAIKQPKDTGLGLAFLGDSEFEWKQLPVEPAARKEWYRGHKALSSLSSLDSLASLDTISSFPQGDGAEVDPIVCDEIGSYPHVAEAPTWSDEVLERDPVGEEIPPTPVVVPSSLPNIVLAHGKSEPPALRSYLD